MQAVAQNGLTYATDHYDLERYDELRGDDAPTMAEGSGVDLACVCGLPKLSLSRVIPV